MHCLIIGGISERTKLPWAHNTLFFMIVWYLSTLTSAHHQQFHITTYIFSFVIMSSFLLKKKHMRETLLFCFNLKKSAAESHRMLVEAYGDNAVLETTCIGFADSKTTILIWVTRSVKIGPGRLRTVNCRLFWMRTIPNRKKCLPSNWVSQAAISMRKYYMPWGRFKKIGKWVPHELNNRQMERRQNTCQILLARQKRKSFLHRMTGDEK